MSLLLEAAMRLREVHSGNDAERMAFAHGSRRVIWEPAR
jgi:hypothetical protein